MPAITPTIAEAVAALKEFATRLASHPRVQTKEWEMNGPAPAEVIAHYRANPHLLPKHLVDLYELMNGCVLQWEYQQDGADLEADEEEDVYGGIALYPLTLDPEHRGLRFGTDEENEYTFFGPTTVSLLFDDMQPDAGTGDGTWLVAYGPGGPATPIPKNYEPYRGLAEDTQQAAHDQAIINNYQLAFLYSKNEVQQMPGTIADYLLAGIAHGFVAEWPLAYQHNQYRAQDVGERVARYQALVAG